MIISHARPFTASTSDLLSTHRTPAITASRRTPTATSHTQVHHRRRTPTTTQSICTPPLPCDDDRCLVTPQPPAPICCSEFIFFGESEDEVRYDAFNITQK